MKAKNFVMAVAALVVAAPAMAQSFNIDSNAATGPGAGAPSALFGAAANQAGTWNALGALTANTPFALLGLNGAATGVTMTSNQALGAPFGSTTNGLGAAPLDVQALLADVHDLGGTATPQRSFTFNGLANGIYNVYTYAMAPDSAAFITRVNVNANAGAGDAGVQLVGGQYAGQWQQGITHALHSNVSVVNGTLVVNTTNAVSFGSLAGFQLVLVPGPGALALLGVAGLVGTRRRRA